MRSVTVQVDSISEQFFDDLKIVDKIFRRTTNHEQWVIFRNAVSWNR